MFIESVMPSNHLILCRPLLLLPSVLPSIGVFSSESVLRIRWPKYWSFSFSISPCNEYSGLISFRINRFDHLAIQGTLKSLLQHHSFKASALSLLLVQLSHPYMTTGNTIALTVLYCFLIWTYHSACGILALWPGIKPSPPALKKAQSLNHWTTREVHPYLTAGTHTHTP